MKIIDFVNKVNSHAPTIDDLLRKDRNMDKSSLEYLIDYFTIKYVPIDKLFHNKIEELFECTNIKNKDIAGIRIHENITKTDYPEYMLFANYYERSRILLQIKTKEIFCQDWFYEDEIMRCANDDELFLMGLAHYWGLCLDYDFKGRIITNDNIAEIEKFDNISCKQNLFYNLLKPYTDKHHR